MPEVSVSTVTPVYSGQDSLEPLVAELDALRTRWAAGGGPLRLREAIFVNDSAVDDSAAVLARLEQAHPWVRVVTLSRNFGQHPATIAGALHSSSHWVVTLDEDLQHPPDRIESLLRRAVEDGLDVVYAKPDGRVHGVGYRDLASRGVKHLVARLAGNPVIAQFNSFRLVRGQIARAAAGVCAHETYYDVALTWFTDKFGWLPLALRDERHAAQRGSGYNLRRLLAHARRLAVSSQTGILRVGAVVGVLATLLALGFGGKILVQKLIDPEFVDVRGWTSLFVSIMFLGGMACFLLGVVLEYLKSVVLHVQGKPPFFVVDRSLDPVVLEHLRGGAGAETA